MPHMLGDRRRLPVAVFLNALQETNDALVTSGCVKAEPTGWPGTDDHLARGREGFG